MVDKICRQQVRKLTAKQTCVELEKALQSVLCKLAEAVHPKVTAQSLTHAFMHATHGFLWGYFITHDVGCNVSEACKPDHYFGQLLSTVQQYC